MCIRRLKQYGKKKSYKSLKINGENVFCQETILHKKSNY
jgi:hypothetical protein